MIDIISQNDKRHSFQLIWNLILNKKMMKNFNYNWAFRNLDLRAATEVLYMVCFEKYNPITKETFLALTRIEVNLN